MNDTNFEDGSVFQATICDQILSRNRNDELQIIFSVKIIANVTTDPGSNAGTESMEPFERDVYVTFCEDRQRLSIARENLKRLGVEEGVDIIKLHPDHPEFVSLIDKEVQVRCRNKGDNTYWNFAWSFRPTAINLKEAEAAARQFQQRLDQKAAYDGNLENPSDGHNPPVSY